jgi:general stress protein YciG
MLDQSAQMDDQNNTRQQQDPRFESAGNRQDNMDMNDATDEGNDGNGRGASNRGFAAMSPERQKQIASEGGRAAHKQGVAHEWNSDEARRAGRKGGQIVSQNREHMSEIGRRGGQSSGGRRTRTQQNESESGE